MSGQDLEEAERGPVASSMHNILTPRGALVRDPRILARYLDEAIEPDPAFPIVTPRATSLTL